MFGWLKRRLVFEHHKLIYLNKLASSDAELATRLHLGGYWDEADYLAILKEIANDMDHAGVPVGGLNDDTVEAAFKINKDLMDLFALGYQKRIADFDQHYRPVGGWKSALKDQL